MFNLCDLSPFCTRKNQQFQTKQESDPQTPGQNVETKHGCGSKSVPKTKTKKNGLELEEKCSQNLQVPVEVFFLTHGHGIFMNQPEP